MEQQDDGLVRAAQAGDQTALAALYDRHLESLYRFIYRHVSHAQEAEDLTSDVMLRMVQNLSSYERTASFRTWLFGIARHAIADFWRKRYRVREELVAEFAGLGAVGAGTEAGESVIDEAALDRQAERAQRVFERLSEPHRTVLQHRFVEQRTLAETAAAMGTTTGNVKVLQYRALKRAAAIAKELP